MIGALLGSYEILEKIGEGGMGEVYRARDRRLERDVAIKILPASFANDPDRLARFEREAQDARRRSITRTSRAIYGLEDADGVRALVMELVEGDDARRASARGRHPARRGAARSPGRLPRHSKRRTTRASSIATSSPPTSRSRPTAR